jgi:23S rRNA pseudouridine955/2504/2580 synthase
MSIQLLRFYSYRMIIRGTARQRQGGIALKQFYIQQNEAGQRLDKLLAKILNKAPKSFIYKMLRKKNITLNGKKADGSEKLEVQDEVKLFLSDETFDSFREESVTTIVEHELDILYEDKHILILNKPLGILSQKAEKEDISMVEHIISYLITSNQLTREQMVSFKPAVCNRLDRNTGGILIAGKSLVGLQEMARLLKDRSLGKYYLCIVKGRVEKKERIEGYLSKDESKNQVTVFPHPSEATEYICTEYEPIAYSENNYALSKYTLLRVKLITGKSHQIRAHLSSMGYPILGDYKYGDQKTNHYFKVNYGLSTQLLHSHQMIFPEIEGELSYLSGRAFTAGLPEQFERIRKDLFGSNYAAKEE